MMKGNGFLYYSETKVDVVEKRFPHREALAKVAFLVVDWRKTGAFLVIFMQVGV